MSISDEIEKIKNAKSDISQAIQGKGVNVPSTAMLSDMAALVDAIPQEGGAITIDATPTEGSQNAVSSG
ncbi:MAG: hypothetical protein NC122_07110, partial [Faecalibacterium sp.]|nr:hypothetical protein [Ruminococcus sp.]MCM1392252.1 hypothetical protein [Ruminococcus sp.]MCM1485960.1 hypothetical protein [Faecalibacterium sp.]